jgi:hypothetical protein
MLKRVMILVLVILALSYGQMPYLPGETVLPEHNLSWTDNYGYSSNIFDEIAVNQRVVMIFWGGHG